jgi:hypothetical protein
MPWIADPTPAYNSCEISSLLVRLGLYYHIRYGFGTIEVELTSTNDQRYARMVAQDMKNQGIDSVISSTGKGGLLIKAVF